MSLLATTVTNHHHHGQQCTPPSPPSIQRKQGHPKGSRNKRPSRCHQQLDTVSADKAFGTAYSFVPPTTNNETVPPSPSEVQPQVADKGSIAGDGENEDFHL